MTQRDKDFTKKHEHQTNFSNQKVFKIQLLFFSLHLQSMGSIIVVIRLNPCYILINNQYPIYQIRNPINGIILIIQILHVINYIIQMLNIFHPIIQMLNVLNLINVKVINNVKLIQFRNSFNKINTIIQMINDDKINLIHPSIYNITINKFILFLFYLLQIT